MYKKRSFKKNIISIELLEYLVYYVCETIKY